MIYLIHFEKPLHHAKHYLGFCEDGNLERRIERHRAGHGSKLMAAVCKMKIDWKVVRTWPEGDRNQERKLKGHSSIRYCPICNFK